MEPTESSRHFTAKPATRPTGHQRVGDQAGVRDQAGWRPSSSVPAGAVARSQRACRRRFARGGACGWLRLQCRRPRDGAQAARFARARPDGRPAGAPRPRRGAGSRLVSHTTRPERAKEDFMNRWTGTGHLTKDPKLLETDGGTAICTLRIAVKRAGKQGQDGYFEVKCFDGQAHACADYLKAGREVAIDGRLLFDEFKTQDGAYASRVYVIAERVEFLASRTTRSNGQASSEASPEQPATRRRGAGAQPGRLTTIAGPRRSTAAGPTTSTVTAMSTTTTTRSRSRHETVTRVPRRARRAARRRRVARAALPPRRRAAHGATLRPPDPTAADSRPGRSRSAAAPTSTSAARRAPAGTAAATPSSAPSCCGSTATAKTPSRRSSTSTRSRRSSSPPAPAATATPTGR